VSTAYLDVHDVHRTFRTGASEVHALRGVSLSAAPGELLAVRGRSGSGKTTLLNVVGGLDRPDDGRVVLDGADVTAMDDTELLGLRRGTVSYVFQSFGLVPILTARENVGIPLRLNEVDPAEREERVASALEHVGLSGHVNQRPGELSGGQQQRVALARALASRPGLLLADEPTGQLDSETGLEIMTLIARLAKEEMMTTVVTTHDPVLLSLADRVVELVDGHLVGTS
jgi:putative ABC transport system ATP-binding protein